MTGEHLGVDANEERLRSFVRIMKLTRAVDALLARQYAVDSKEQMLDDLCKCMDNIERSLDTVEEQTSLLQQSSADSGNDAARYNDVVQQSKNDELSRLWDEHGEAMTRQLKRHTLRLQRIVEMTDDQGDRTHASTS